MHSSVFWVPFAITFFFAELFFAWELGYFINVIPSYPRPYATNGEVIFTGIIGFLLAVNVGLIAWQRRFGHCPIGVKRASGAAGLIGALTLICPACVLLPAGIAGAGFIFAALTPHLILLRIIAIFVLLVATWMLWPKKRRK